MRLLILGLSITSSWGNGHATTYRALVRALHALGHDVLFLERDVPWYASNRDDRTPQGCQTELYTSLSDLADRFTDAVRTADSVMVGSYVPDGAEVVRWVLSTARGLKLFYDIDTPVTLSKLARGDTSYLAPESIPELDAYLSFTGGPVLRRLERELGARLALPLYCSVDEKIYAPAKAKPTRDLGYLGTYSDDRQPTLHRLLVEPAKAFDRGRFVVAGSCFPERLVWPHNVERIEHVAPREHPEFYGSLRFTLNVTRADMIRCGYSPSVRLFEAAACGVPVISDDWEGIDEFFEPGKQILLASESAQVLDYLKNLPEKQRQSISVSARRRMLEGHTSLLRARQLERYVLELRAKREARPRRPSTARETSLSQTGFLSSPTASESITEP